MLELYFAYGSEGIVLITEEELNNEHPATETKVFLGGYPVDPIPEEYSEPVWTWNEDLTAAYATFTRSDGATKTVDAEIEVEEVEADCEIDGAVIYTATVEFNGETYTDVVEVVIPAYGHEYGEPTWKWAEDKASATATFVCENNESHVETVEAVVELELTETDDGLVNVYTATAEFNGEEYTDIIEVSGVFAGWYKDMAFTDPYTETPAEDDVKYAKLVAPETFDVKVQVAELNAGDTVAKVRFISTVDSSSYNGVKFVVTYGENTLEFNAPKLYRKLNEYLGMEGFTDPKVFSEDSVYFSSVKAEIPAEAFNTDLTVTIMLITCDGTEIIGGSTEFKVEDNYVFAGWYHDAEFPSPFKAAPEDGEEAYAKYVHKDTFKTVVQLVTPEDGATGFDARFITSADASYYDSIVFKVEYASTVKTVSVNSLYRKLVEYNGYEAITDPTALFSSDSAYFASVKTTIADEEAFNTEITIYAQFVTADGTVINGEPTTFIVTTAD